MSGIRMPWPATIDTARESKSLDITEPGWSAVCIVGSRSTACSDFIEKEIAKIKKPIIHFDLRLKCWRVPRVVQSQRLKANLYVPNVIDQRLERETPRF